MGRELCVLWVGLDGWLVRGARYGACWEREVGGKEAAGPAGVDERVGSRERGEDVVLGGAFAMR